MRIIVQKAIHAHVVVDQEVIGAITQGYVLFVGITPSDTEADLAYLAKKVAFLRIYPDEEGKMNKNIMEMQGEILSISQFTLYGDATEGNRPSFVAAAPKEIAEPLFERFNTLLRTEYGLGVQSGRFGAHMEVTLNNDGPTTLLLESKKKKNL
jgi:D-tyrosyl-tRNA(Tyr) deacylase